MRRTLSCGVSLLTVVLAAHAVGAADPPPSDSPGPEVQPPPAEWNVNPYYTKYLDAGGYPIVASAEVNDYALKEAAYLINAMLARRPEVKRAMAASGSRLLIIPHNQFTTDLPEYSQMKPKDYWDARARGLGGSRTDPYCSCGEENLLCYPGDPYSTENILIHEFAHNIHLRGMVNLDPTFDDRLKATYDAAMKQGLWEGKYASTNHHEYFAEGVQSWFNNNRENDHDHNHVNTRVELKEYDPGLAAMCDEVFGETELVYTRPQTRLQGHLAGYDPTTAPEFKWPERLTVAKAEIRKQAENRSELRKQQRENRLAWTSTDAADPPASANRDETGETSVLFENESEKTVVIHWKDFSGNLKRYESIRPQGRHQQHTYPGHVWVVTDEAGRVLGHFVADVKPATASIPKQDP